MLKNHNVILETDDLKELKSNNLSELIRRLIKEYLEKRKKENPVVNPYTDRTSWEQYAEEERKKLAFKEAQEVFILKRKKLEDDYETARLERMRVIDIDPLRAKELVEEMRLIKEQLNKLDAGVI